MSEAPITVYASTATGLDLAASGEAISRDDEMSLLDLGVTIAENIRLLVFGPLLAGLIALVIAFMITPSFTARTSFLPPQRQQSAAAAALADLGALSGLASSQTGLKNPSDQYGALTKSRTVADRLVERFGLLELYKIKSRDDARNILSGRSQVTVAKEGLIIVEVQDESPQRAADLANAYVIELRGLLSSLALTEAQQRRAFFEMQLEQTKARLTAAELSLATSGVGSSAIKADPSRAVEAVARIQAQITVLEVKLAAMRGYVTESAPEFIRARDELAALRAQLQKSGKGELKGASEGEYIEKYREFKYQETLLELFARQFELAKVDEAREGTLVQVIDAALPPEHKTKPQKALIAILTTLASGMVLLLWVFAQKALAVGASHPQAAGKLAAIGAGLRQLFMLPRTRQ